MLRYVQEVNSEYRSNVRTDAPVRDPRPPESISAVLKLRLIPSEESVEIAPAMERKPVSEPERELNSFINSIATLIGPGASRTLTDLGAMVLHLDLATANHTKVSIDTFVQ